jgi:hypothetical protein
MKHEKTGETFQFNPLEVKKAEPESSVKLSDLSKLIQQNEKEFNSGSNKGKLRLTIYLPDFSDIQVYAAVDCTVGELIKVILKQHEQEDGDPPLEYHNPTRYEMRMHEGNENNFLFRSLFVAFN